MDKETYINNNNPKCDICKNLGMYSEALYDGKTMYGLWAYMCEKHFKDYGVGLGTGRGQKLIKRQSLKTWGDVDDRREKKDFT